MPLNKPNLFENTSIDQTQFLTEFWHKKPIILPQAVVGDELKTLPTTEQLKQLSCKDDVQSRIVFKNSEISYDVEYGPFDESDWDNINDECWNLLVSDIDKWQPETKTLLKYFQFIRNWLFDDIMLSCGSINGTVGPHTDQYDVFLLQVEGQRQWSFDHDKSPDPTLIADQPLKLISDYTPQETVVLYPGDVLYIPPNIAHYGIAQTKDCVTCSIGTRTPSHAELITSFVDHIAQRLSDNKRFREINCSELPQTGEITQTDLNEISQIISQSLFKPNASAFNQWFGQFISEYRSLFYEFNHYQQANEIDNDLPFYNSAFSKNCYFAQSNQADLFVDGKHFVSSLNLAQSICDAKKLTPQQWSTLNKADQQTVIALFENGSLVQRL